MDNPQWYNKKLWLTSKQSIDGKPVRSHSASYSNRRSGYNSQAMSGNWANYLKVNNLTLPNRDRGFNYRYSYSKRPTNSAINNQAPAYTSNYLVTPMSYVGKLSAINPSQPLTLHPKPMTSREKFNGSQNENKLIKPQLSNKIIQPQYVEYGQDFYSLSKKFDFVHGNINSNEEKIEEEEKSSDIEEILMDSLNITSSTPVPQNTPRFINSSQESIPKKSILKKTVNIVCQPDIYRNSNNQIPSASLKPMVSSQPLNRFFEIRKNLQSAPSTKREVRFDMNNNNIIEFSTND